MKSKLVSDCKVSEYQRGVNKFFEKVHRCETDSGLINSLEVFSSDRSIMIDWECDKINRADGRIDWWKDDEE